MDFNPDKLQALLEQDLGIQIDEVRSFKAEALKTSLLKKYVPRERQGDLHVAALQNFCAINDRVTDFVIDPSFVSSDIFICWRSVLYDALLSGELGAPRVSLTGALDNGRCGPGSSIGAADTSFFTKMFDSHLTTTSDFLYEHFSHNLSARWSKAEAFRLQDYSVKVVPGSRMTTVPKNRDKNRTTCTEPILNMFYQLGVKTQLESVLKSRFNIDLSIQPELNKRLARIGSINGEFATIDMKDASDSISVKLVELLLPPSVTRTLMRIRSRFTHVDKQLVKLAMVSTMGNGFTFALMTMLFASLIKAIFLCHNLKYENGVTSCVFGDDLIVPTELAQELIDCLSNAGLVVNVEKSFTEGPFRESCGGDYYLGHDVRGIYIKEFTHETHCYSAFNRLHLWSVKHGFCLERTLQYLRSLVEFRPVPWDSGVDSGFIVTSAELLSPKHDRNGAIIYHCFAPRPLIRGRCGDRIRNIHGGLISFLGGYIRDDNMLLRPQGLSYRVVKRKTPSWDFIGDPAVNLRDLSRSWTMLLS